MTGLQFEGYETWAGGWGGAALRLLFATDQAEIVQSVVNELASVQVPVTLHVAAETIVLQSAPLENTHGVPLFCGNVAKRGGGVNLEQIMPGRIGWSSF